MRSIEREKHKSEPRVYEYATGRGGIPIGNQSPMDDESTDWDYQYATGRGGKRLSSQQMEQLRGTHYGKGPKGWKRSDEKIREEVCESLFLSGDVDASDIDVSVTNGVVSLKGTVDSRFSKKLVEDITDDVTGVTDVQNTLTIKKEESPSRLN